MRLKFSAWTISTVAYLCISCGSSAGSTTDTAKQSEPSPNPGGQPAPAVGPASEPGVPEPSMAPGGPRPAANPQQGTQTGDPGDSSEPAPNPVPPDPAQPDAGSDPVQTDPGPDPTPDPASPTPTDPTVEPSGDPAPTAPSSTAPDGGAAQVNDAGVCPVEPPAPGDACRAPGELCGYGDDPRVECRSMFWCDKTTSTFVARGMPAAGCSGPLLPAECPAEPPTGECMGGQEPSCHYGDGVYCRCFEECYDLPCGFTPNRWHCTAAPEEPCPADEPNHGSACSLPEGTACRYANLGSCRYEWVCEGGAWKQIALECLDCNAAETPIDTPDGPRPIWQLQPGDLVYSMHEGELAIVPIAAVRAKPQVDHHVVELVLDNGSVLNISPNHPVANGLPLGRLLPGDVLDGARVTSVRLVRYTETHTFDILPESDTGTYFAAGVHLGSTLFGLE